MARRPAAFAARAAWARVAPGEQGLERLEAVHGVAGVVDGGDRRGRQRGRFTMPSGRNHLRNSQVTSVEHDRHRLLTHL
jgi:hypothetical protein